MAATPTERLKELGITLPAPHLIAGHYVNATQVGDQLLLAGHGPLTDGRPAWRGKVPTEVSLPDAVAAARLTALNCLSTVAHELGDLDRVERVVKVFGMVNAERGFEQHPLVIDGASALLLDVFGDRGIHVRAAVGMGSLPFQIPVEIEMVFQIR
jgi:enamine deaminase RidA (YjgF/YER057c/UK114 family)